MTIITCPESTDFTGRCADLVIDTDTTIRLRVDFNDHPIIQEEYSPDASNQVRVRQLGRLCSLALWGRDLAYTGIQDHHGGRFEFFIDDEPVADSRLYYSSHYRPRPFSATGILTDCLRRTAYPGFPETVSGFPLESRDSEGGGVIRLHAHLIAFSDDGHTSQADIPLGERHEADIPMPYTISITPEQVEKLTSERRISSFIVQMQGGGVTFHVMRGAFTEVGHLRFRNLYDLPDTIHFTGGLSLSAANESETAIVGGVERKFGVRIKDEYTLYSGAIRFGEEYRLWRDLCNSSEVELYTDDTGWTPVVITKYKLQREPFGKNFRQAELTLTLAEERLYGAGNL